jgi:hypothetical protein
LEDFVPVTTTLSTGGSGSGDGDCAAACPVAAIIKQNAGNTRVRIMAPPQVSTTYVCFITTLLCSWQLHWGAKSLAASSSNIAASNLARTLIARPKR